MNNALTPIEDLDRNILSLSTHINAATYELLLLVREFDERAGWLQWGLHNCAEWLAWRCDLGLSAAREKVRVAHALKTLPEISAAFATGELSYSKVRAMTRVAGPHNEQVLLEFALRATAQHVDERCRELRFGDDRSTDLAQRAFASRSLRVLRNAERGLMTITVELPLESGELIEKALDKAREDEVSQAPDLVDTSWQMRQADAFVSMANEYLSGTASEVAQGADNFLVNIHVDQTSLAGREGRSSLPIESVKRLCCDSRAVVITENENGEPLTVGRKTRIVPKAIRRAVQARDKGCVFPGCHNKRFVDAHHVQHWSAGGETSLGNLMLLCGKHHTLVHEGGFRIEKDFQDRWFFRRPDGVAVPSCGYVSEVVNYPSAEGLLSRPENFAAEPPPVEYWH